MKNDFQPIKSDMKQERDKLCYLTIGDKDEKWGVVVTTIGYQFIPPGTKYPLSAHPDNYSFMPRGGRILNEYQLVYITKGSGYFASQSCPEAPVKAGTVISLFPGEWHSYHPDDETGWDEYWVGFKGAYIDDRVANRFLVREQPLHNIGISSGIVSLYEEILQLASVEKAGCQQMMSSIVLHILGSIYYKERNNSYANTFILEKVNAARELMKDVDNPPRCRGDRPGTGGQLFVVPQDIQGVHRDIPRAVPVATAAPEGQRDADGDGYKYIGYRLCLEVREYRAVFYFF